MKQKLLLAGVLSVLLTCCKNKSIPDVSRIPVTLTLVRFEKDFFSLDTTQLAPSLQALQKRHPWFYGDFLQHILGLGADTDSLSAPQLAAITQFLRDYRPIYDSAGLHFTQLEATLKELRDGLQRVRYYFPGYPLPNKLITFVGPMDAFYEASLGSYGDVLTRDGLATGLQLHLGADFSMYQSAMGQALYPNYISRRFTPGMISVNALKNIVDDLYPDQSRGMVLIDQMVEKGKRLYVLDQLMPYTPDSLKLGYTAAQLHGCLENEGKIWNFLVTNNFLLRNDPVLTKAYLSDGPKTPELGDGSPGYIGLFVGRQIVNAYMEKHAATTLQELLQTDARKIYEDSKYRPK